MLEAALVGRGSGEFIATTHCGGGGGGRADDMVKECQRINRLELAGRITAMGGVGRRSQSGKDDGSCQEVPSAAHPLPLRLTPRFSFPSASLSHSPFSLHPTPVNCLWISNYDLSMIFPVSDSPDRATVVVQ